MKNISRIKFSFRVVVLAVALVMLTGIPNAIGKLPIGPIADQPVYPGGPVYPLLFLPIVNVNVPYEFTPGTTISASQMNNNFKAVGNQMPGVDWATIKKTKIDVTSTVTLNTVTISAPTAGYVVVRFDGQAIADTGDRLVLAASDDNSWHPDDGTVAFLGDGHPHSFSHTRVYAVSAGSKTFYAVAQNYVDTAGNGKASIYGTLTATFYPNNY